MTAADEIDDEFKLVFDTMIKERAPADGTKLDAVSVALIRRAAMAIISDSADPGLVLKLLESCPPPQRKRAAPEVTLDEIASEDRPLRLELLTRDQLDALEEAVAIGTGRACPIRNPRLLAAHAVVEAFEGVGSHDDVEALDARERERVRLEIVGLLGHLCRPFKVHELLVHPQGPPPELVTLRARVTELEALLAARSPKALPPPWRAAPFATHGSS
jgi:hypothetical protein